MYSRMHTLLSGETSTHSTHWRPRDNKAAEWRQLHAELEREIRAARKARMRATTVRPRRWTQWKTAWPFSGSR